jgi:ketosteroid isomerase-like protein
MEASMTDKNDIHAIEQATEEWYRVLNAMLNGDPEPFSELWSHADDVTYMGANGNLLTGWNAVFADWKQQAKVFLQGKVEPSDVHVSVCGNMGMSCAFSNGTQHYPDGSVEEAILRESSVFRKEEGCWKMISHHADTLPVFSRKFNEL